MIDELLAESSKEKAERNEALEAELLIEIKKNEDKIRYHGQSASDIVKRMLQNPRTRSGQKEFIDVNDPADEYLRLAYHGLQAKDMSFQSDYKIDAYQIRIPGPNSLLTYH